MFMTKVFLYLHFCIDFIVFVFVFVSMGAGGKVNYVHGKWSTTEADKGHEFIQDEFEFGEVEPFEYINHVHCTQCIPRTTYTYILGNIPLIIN